MAKINLNDLPKEKALTILRRYQRNKYKNGMNSADCDPYVNEATIMKKFTITIKLATEFVEHLILANNKYSPYVQHFISYELQTKLNKTHEKSI